MAAYILTCRVPVSHIHKMPVSVSMVERVCDDATTNLRIIHNTPETPQERKTFAVCSKGFSILDDQSLQVAEWFEILRALGTDKIDIYTMEVHPNIQKVTLQWHHEPLIANNKRIQIEGDQTLCG